MVVIVAYENYPDGSPGAIRCKSFADAYFKFGYDVTVIHKGTFSQERDPLVISCYTDNRFKKFFGFNRSVIKHLENLKCASDIEAVIMYGYNRSVYNWCQHNKIICVTDVVEWYSKEQFNKWYTSIEYWKKQIEIKLTASSKCRVIAISSYLQKYFCDKGLKAVRIPIIVNQQNNHPLLNNQSEDMIRIIYAGSHLMMDNIPLILKSISSLTEEERCRIRFSIYGLTKEDIQRYLPEDIITKTDNCCTFFGRRPNAEVLSAYHKSHFSIFLRNSRLRVNKAGFPSKVVESMKMGVPVICNLSSDLALYLKNNENSIIVTDLTIESIVKVLRKIMSISSSDLIALRKASLTTINTCLNADSFRSAFEDIISL